MIVAAVSALLLVVPAASAAPGDLTPGGCYRDFESTLGGCTATPDLDAGWGIVASADGRNVYSVGFADDSLVTFERDPLTGGLIWRSCFRFNGRSANGCTLVPGLDGPMSITISPDDRNVYVGADLTDSVAAFTRDTGTGVLTFSGCARDVESATPSCTPAQGLDEPRDVTLSPDGTSIYVVSALDDTLVHLNRDLTFRGCMRESTHTGTGCTAVTGVDGPRAVVVSPDGADVYVAGRDGHAASTYRRATDGSLTWTGCFKDAELAPGVCQSAQGLERPHGVAISPDGKSVYFPGEYDDSVATFQRDPTTGTLQYRSCLRDSTRSPLGCTSAPGLDGARQLKVSPDGRNVYVAAATGDAVVHLNRDTTNGALTFAKCFRDPENTVAGCTGSAQGLDGVRAVAITADGKSVYVNSDTDDTVVRFVREPFSSDPPPPPPPPPADTTAPSVAFTAPAAGSTVSGTVACAADASDNTGVARVEFLVDGAPLSTDTASPYGCSWNTTTVADGVHTLTAVAYDAAGNSSRTDRSVTVTNAPPPPPPPADTTSPTVAFTAPAAGAAVSGTVACAATASDDTGVARVEFLVDGAPLSTDTSAPYGCSWNTTTVADGVHTLTAVAYDAAGNSSRTDRSVTVTNAPPPPPPANTAPTVQLTSPLTGAFYRDSMLFTADATDDAGVTKVEFWAGGSIRAVDTTAPYSVIWQVNRNLQKEGTTLTVYARAYDAQGLATKSTVATVRYSKSAPSATMAKKKRCGKLKRRAAKKSRRCAAKKRAARAR